MPKFLAFFLLSLLFCFSCACKNFYQPTALVVPAEKAAIAAGKTPDTVTVTVGRHYQKGFLQRFFFGKHYRELWATPVQLPVFNRHEVLGGLTPVSMGGGFQTTSLTLKTDSGQTYVLRSLDKDPQKTLPPHLRNTFLVNIVRDQTSAANPFAPLVLPRLSKAAGVFHTNPEFYYVAENDSTMGEHAARVNGKVMLLEEKFESKKNLTPAFGNAVDLVDSEDLLEKRFENSKHQIDQCLFVKSRLFDILIGDWDRHEGQWNWAVYKENDHVLYKPVPKDRDQTFYRFNDGLITRIASGPFLLKKLQTFHKNYGNLKGWLYNARFIDGIALNEVTREEWLQIASEMKANLTDDVIAEAFAELPPPVYAKDGPETIARLKSRRDKLPEAATDIYKILSKEVTIAGTDGEERFVVERFPNGDTKVQVFNLEKKTDKPFYERTFHKQDTKKIILHGLAGKDKFEFSGKAKSAIEVAVYGGRGEDELEDKTEIKGWGKTIKVYDTHRGIEMERTREVKRKLSWNVAIHAFDREGL